MWFIDLARQKHKITLIVRGNRNFKYASLLGSKNEMEKYVEVLNIDFSDITKMIEDRFDIIIADVTDPWGESSFLYTKEFYELIYNALKDDGIFVTQSTQIALSVDVYAVIHSTISSIFPISRLYHTFVPSFLLDWSFNIGSKKYDPIALSGEEIDSRIRERIAGDLKFYDSETHKHMFSIPKHVRRALNSTKKISTDSEPIYLPI